MLATTAGQTIFVAIPRVAFGALEGLKGRYCWLHNHGLSESLDRRLSSAADSKRFQPPSLLRTDRCLPPGAERRGLSLRIFASVNLVPPELVHSRKGAQPIRDVPADTEPNGFGLEPGMNRLPTSAAAPEPRSTSARVRLREKVRDGLGN